MAIELNIDRICDGSIQGWGWDTENPHDAITVELWRGPTLISAVRANFQRPDVRRAGRGTGLYGYSLKIPVRDYPEDHHFFIRVPGCEKPFLNFTKLELLHDAILKDLANTLTKQMEPRLIGAQNEVSFAVRKHPGGLAFSGRIDGLPVSARLVAMEGAETDRVVVSTPRSFRDEGAHKVELNAAGQVICEATVVLARHQPVFKGNVEGVGNGALNGWCFDETEPESAARLEIYVDNQLRDVIVANHCRNDLQKLVPGGACGFRWPLPDALRDGRAHAIKVIPLFGEAPLSQKEPQFIFPWRQPAKLYRFSPPMSGMEADASAYSLQDASVAEAFAGATAADEWRKSMPVLLRSLARKPRVTVFVPIYNAAASVALCLQSLVRNTSYHCEFLLIDDASPQEEIGPLLDGYEGRSNFQIIRNAENIGYTRNCNQALSLTQGDVVFLNSDTYVPPRWLERLVVAAYRRRDVATVTATSNRSGAFSVPEPYGANRTPAQVTPEDYATLLSRASGLNQPLVPTGNGFCMYVRRESIEDIGGFDEKAFPRGYGEENDFCMRALKAGWVNVIDDRSFVYHIRSASFGGQQPELQASAQNTLAARHPDYTILTQTFSNDAALFDMRGRAKRVACWLGDPRVSQAANRLSRPRILYVLHYTGEGGTALTTRDLVGQVDAEFECFLLTTENDVVAMDYWRDGEWRRAATLKLDGPMDMIDAPRPDYEAAVSTLLLAFDISLLHVRHLIAHSFYLPRIAHRLNIPVVMSYHDFYAVCPSVTLVDDKGAYCRGVCTPGFGECPTMVTLPPEMQPLKHGYIANWRDRVETTFTYCDVFITTSNYVRELFYRAFPKLHDKHDFRVIEHGRNNTPQPSLAAAPVADKPFRVLLLGNILNKHKGFGVARAIRELDHGNDVEFHFLGAAPPDAASVGTPHGRYQREELARRISEIQPNAIAIFSIWPETYCHTLSEAWQLGVPALGSIFGAVGERINRHGGGWAVDCDDPASILALIRRIKTHPEEWEEARLSASARNLRSTRAMAVDYIEIYKQRLMAKSVCGGRVQRIFIIGGPSAADWAAPVQRLRTALRHPAVAPHVNLIDAGPDSWLHDRFACDAATLAIIDDLSLTYEQVKVARDAAKERGAACRLLSEMSSLALTRFVDERNWLPMLSADAPEKSRIGGQDLPNVALLLTSEDRTKATELVNLCQTEMICRMTVIEVAPSRLCADSGSAIGNLDEVRLARQLAAMTRNCVLAVLAESDADWDRSLVDRIGLLGLPSLMLLPAAAAQEAAQLLAERLATTDNPQRLADIALAKASIQRNAEAIVAELEKLVAEARKAWQIETPAALRPQPGRIAA